ncbi:MAG TPA: ABC transporter permease [Melioribacteraceae bacterium]|nr:ABC transporter permease [Melioribacteraceae bacterium]
MNFSIFIANRYVRSKRGSKFLSLISVISFLGIALGVAVVIIAMAILQGFDNTVRDKIVKLNSHLQVTAFSKKNLPYINNFDSFIKKKLDNNVISVSPFLSKEAIIKSKTVSEGIFLLGLDPKADNSEINKFIIKGSFDISDSSTIIIGKKLAEKLFLKINDKVTLFSLKSDELPSELNPPAISQFIVKGIYESGMAEYDDVNCYINLNEANNFLGLNNTVSGYNIKLNNISNLDSIVTKLQEVLGYPYYVRSIYKVHQNIFTWLDLQKEPVPIILGLIIIVAVFNIVGALLMLVLEKTASIGILKSMGAKNSQILRIFLYQGFYLGILGIITGNIFAFILSFLQLNYKLISLPGKIYFIDAVPITINPLHYLVVSFATIILCLGVSLIPSKIATKIKPINAIRFE